MEKIPSYSMWKEKAELRCLKISLHSMHWVTEADCHSSHVHSSNETPNLDLTAQIHFS